MPLFVRSRLAAVALVLSACSFSGDTGRPAPVVLTVAPHLTKGRFQALDVSLTFTAGERTETVLRLPNEWGGERELYRALTDLQAEGASLTDTDRPDRRLLRHAPSARIVVTYRVVHEPAEARKKQGNDYRPIVQPTYFQALGNAIVVQPESVRPSDPARFAMIGMPKGTAFASDLEHQHMGRRLSFADLVESVLVGGDFRVLDAGHGARIAIRGEWARRDDEWQRMLGRIASAERAYWGAGEEPYLVTILPLADPAPGAISVGGTGRDDAFAFFATRNAPPERLDKVLAHEMMHTWVPRRIGRLPDRDEPLHYWVSEGFTDWASFRVMARAGLWSPAAFAQAFNESLRAYDASPARNAPNAAILDKFWRDPTVQALPYQRGMLLATHWDHAVRRATAGARNFDHVLLEMQRLSATVERKTGMAVAHLRTAMQTVAGLDIDADLERYVERGETVPVAEETFAPCGRVRTLTRKVFDRGFDVEATMRNRMVVHGVAVDGPAHRAGLRDGMTLVRRAGGTIGDSRAEIVYEVLDGDTPRTLRWLPAGRQDEVFREWQLDGDPDAAACRQRLGGA